MMHVDPAQFVRAGRSFEILPDTSYLHFRGGERVWKLRCINGTRKQPACTYRAEDRAMLAGVLWVLTGIQPAMQPEFDTAHPAHAYSPSVERLTKALVQMAAGLPSPRSREADRECGR